MPAGTTAIKNELTKALKINEMPALVILDDEGNVVTVQGAQKIMALEKGNVEQAAQLVDRWKKTRPISIAEVKMDNTLLHGTMERGTVYWHNN
jgi:ABC-type sulfate/molybdate transport systems ATPase subunit